MRSSRIKLRKLVLLLFGIAGALLPLWLGRLLLLAIAAAFLPLWIGCGPSVREGRSITWSPEGQAVGFQHGHQGVFVADEQGGKLRKIFQPGTDVCAVSTPLWSPAGRRVIFTTARDDPGQQPRAQAAGRDPYPEGNLYSQRPVRSTCWLWDAAGRGQPRSLFEASCDHAGYVAANLAVSRKFGRRS